MFIVVGTVVLFVDCQRCGDMPLRDSEPWPSPARRPIETTDSLSLNLDSRILTLILAMFDISTPAVFLSCARLPAGRRSRCSSRSLRASGEQAQADFAGGHGRRVLLMSLSMIFGWSDGAVRRRRRPACRTCSAIDWIPSFNIHYLLGIDGISFPLVLLTSFLSMLAMGASWPITKHVKAYCILFLLLGNGHAGRVPGARFLPVLRVLGSDAAADVLPDRHLGRAAARIRRHQVLPVHAGRQRADADRHPDAVLHQRPAAARRPSSCRRRRRQLAARRSRQTSRAGNRSADNAVHTFNILALPQMGQHTDAVQRARCCGASRSHGGRSCCCSSASSSRCPPCRCTPGCPTPTSRRPRRSR